MNDIREMWKVITGLLHLSSAFKVHVNEIIDSLVGVALDEEQASNIKQYIEENLNTEDTFKAKGYSDES